MKEFEKIRIQTTPEELRALEIEALFHKSKLAYEQWGVIDTPYEEWIQDLVHQIDEEILLAA